jgi:hypothetical protein
MIAERFGPGAEKESPQWGDFILTHRKEPSSLLIAAAQRLRFRGEDRPYAHWSHVALIASQREIDKEPTLVEAWWSGVRQVSLSEYKDIEYHYVRTNLVHHDRRQAVDFVQACIGQQYGWPTLVATTPSLLFGDHIEFGLNGTQICSGLVARSLERGQYIFPTAPNMMLPGHLAKHFLVRP